MHISNNNSPSFGKFGIHRASAESLLSPLKTGVAKNFAKRAAKLDKISDKLGVDVVMFKRTPDSIQGVFGNNIEKTMEYITNAVNNAVEQIGGRINDLTDNKIKAAAFDAAKHVAGLDEAAQAEAERVASDVSDAVFRSFQEQSVGIEDGIMHEILERTKENIINELAAPVSDKFSIEIKGTGDNPVSKTMEDMEMPTVVRRFTNIFRRKNKKPSMALMFKQIETKAKETSELNKIMNTFGI